MEAIFSSQETRREKEILTGAAGVAAGLILSVIAIFRIHSPQALGPFSDAIYSSLAFGSVGILLLICGAGTITLAIIQRESNKSQTTRSERDDSSSILADTEVHTGTRGMFGPNSRIGAVAFVQSLALVVLYSAFVQEFESNITMQIWLQSNFPVGQSVLNWEGVLVLAVFLGVLLLQFLPGRYFSE